MLPRLHMVLVNWFWIRCSSTRAIRTSRVELLLNKQYIFTFHPTAHSTIPRTSKGARRVVPQSISPKQHTLHHARKNSSVSIHRSTNQTNNYPPSLPFSTQNNSMLSIITACMATLCPSLAILHQRRTQLSTPQLYILWTIVSVVFTTTLYNIDAEPWAYLLGFASLSLYITIRSFQRKYHGVSLNKNVPDRNNRRARRRER